MSGAEARGQGPTDDRPYNETMAYDAMGHLTLRELRHWDRYDTTGTATYINNRAQYLQYDADGRLLSGISYYSYDAAGRISTFGDGDPYETDQQLDGDGRRLKSTLRSFDPNTSQWTAEKVTYYVHSSVMGEVISEVSAQGAKERSFVFAGGQILAIQSTAGGQFVSWEHYDASGASYRPTNSQGQPGISKEMDPLGANAGTMKPLTWPQPTSPGKLEPYYGVPELNSAFSGCILDDIPVPCDMVTGENSAQCDDNHCGPVLYEKRDKKTGKVLGHELSKPFQAFADGGSGHLPRNAVYTGHGSWVIPQLGELGAGKFTDSKQSTQTRQELTVCQKFYLKVQEIADRAKSVKAFLDEFARTFTSANSSDPEDMIAANVVTPPGHPANQFNSNNGIRDEFRLPTDYPGQIRHFAAAFIASAAFGAFGEDTMNDRENPNDADGQTDLAVNRLAFDIRRKLEGRLSVGPEIALIKRDFAKQIRERFCTG